MSGALPTDLLERLCRLGATLPDGVCGELAAAIRKAGTLADQEEAINQVLPRLLPDNRGLLSEFATARRRSLVNISGAEIAAALEAASFQERRLRELSSVELVWTGPSTLSAGLRSTEQVILDMISRAKRSIYLVTFAAYRVEAVAAALRDAIFRGVRVALVLEDKVESEGKVHFNALASLAGGDLRALKVYVWPLEQRKRNDLGKHGTLHAKCVLVDSDRLFVSSANMTSFALALNIELGVLLNGGDAPRQMERNLAELIRTGVLREHQSGVSSKARGPSGSGLGMW